jgi:hypothetical protein
MEWYINHFGYRLSPDVNPIEMAISNLPGKEPL